MPTETVNVRYIVDDVEAAAAWYTRHLGFKLLSNQAPAFAEVMRGCAPRGCGSATTSSPARGGSQILLIDPSNNFVELFQPARR